MVQPSWGSTEEERLRFWVLQFLARGREDGARTASRGPPNIIYNKFITFLSYFDYDRNYPNSIRIVVDQSS